MNRAVLVSKSVQNSYANASVYVPGIDEHLFLLLENGVFYKFDAEKNVLAVASGYIPLDDAVKRVVYSTQAIDSDLISAVTDNPFVVQSWFLSKESVSRIYPAISVRDIVPGADLTDYFFYNLVTPIKNPERKSLWTTEPYVDPAGRGWMISALAPVYLGGEFKGVVGLDVDAENLFDQRVPRKIKNKFMIVDSRGITVWAGTVAGKIFGVPELRDHKYFEMVYQDTFRSEDYSILKSRKKNIRKLSRSIMNSDECSFDLKADGIKYKIFARKIKSLGWTVIEVDED